MAAFLRCGGDGVKNFMGTGVCREVSTSFGARAEWLWRGFGCKEKIDFVVCHGVL